MTKNEARERCKTDLYFLMTEVLEYERFYTPLHKPLANMVQAAPKKSLILIPRDHLKTTLITQGRGTQVKLIDPDCRILICSALKDLTLTILDAIRRHFEGDNRLTWLYPEARMPERGRKDSGRRHEFSVPIRQRWSAKETCYAGAAVDASQVSRHFDYIFLDDLVSDRNTRTAEGMQTVIDFYRAIHPLLEPTGQMYIVGTRWDQADLYGEIKPELEKQGAFIMVRRVMEFDEVAQKKVPIYPKTDLGEPRYTEEHIRELRRDMGLYQFSCQYENDPLPDAQQRVMAPDQIIQVDELPHGVLNFMFIDPAFSRNPEADEVAIVVVATDHLENIYVHDVVSGRLRASDVATHVWTMWRKYDIQAGWCETNALQNVYKEYIQKLCGDFGGEVKLRDAPPRTMKTGPQRIMGLATHFERGRIIFLRNGRGIRKTIQQLKTWSKKRAKTARDDIVSALSDAPQCVWFPGNPRGGQVPTSQVLLEHFASLDLPGFGYDDPMNIHLPKVRL